MTDRAGSVCVARRAGWVCSSLRVVKEWTTAERTGWNLNNQIYTGAGTISSADWGAPAHTWIRIACVGDFPIAVGRDDIANLSIPLRPGLGLIGRAEFAGSRDRPPTRLVQVPVLIETTAQTSRIAPVTGRFDAYGQFSAFGFPGGKYVIRVGTPPQGWSLQSITYNGRDVSDTPFNLETSDVTGVTFTFTDRPTEVIGTVRNNAGTGDPGATVIVFPSDGQTWSSMWLNPRRFRSMRVEPTGVFKISPLPAGSYFIVAIPDEVAGDWQDPSFLDALSRSASQLTIAEGESKTFDLRIRELR